MEFLLSITDQKDMRYCPYHRRNDLQWSIALLSVFDDNQKSTKFYFKKAKSILTMCYFPSMVRKVKAKG